MTRILPFFAFVLVASFALLGTVAAPVAGQPGNVTNASAQLGEQPTPTPAGEKIDANTYVLDSWYESETGTAHVKLKSKVLQSITLTDAGGPLEGGQISQNTVTLRPGETATITVPATKFRGFVGVTVTTRETLWGEPIEDIRLNRDPVDYQTAQILVLLAAAGGAGMTYRVVRERYQDEDDWYRRVL